MCYGTTHADYFYGSVPCTRQMTEKEIEEDYEKNTGTVIVEAFQQRKLDPMAIPSVLVCKHGSFSWGRDCANAASPFRRIKSANTVRCWLISLFIRWMRSMLPRTERRRCMQR